MDYKQKSEEYRVSIRKKNINQKMGMMRAKQKEVYYDVSNPKDVVQHISNILSNPSSNIIYNNLKEIKLCSQNVEVMSLLKQHFDTFYLMIIEIDAKLVEKSIEKEQAYNDLITILINITSEDIINFTQSMQEDIITPLLKNIHKKKRQINTIWLIANILYRHNTFSSHFMKGLVRQGISSYLKQRLNLAFQSEMEMTIFYYFVGGLATNLDFIQSFNQYKNILLVFQSFSQMQIQQLYWFLLDGLIQHAYTFNKYTYEIFSTKIFSKCQQYCKAKKSRFILKYLEIISHFLQGQSQQLYRISEQGKKKIITEQYQRLKKNLILKNLDFCLDNRSPQVKKSLFEIGYMLIALYNKEISYIQQYFYLTLAEQVKSIEKYEEKVVIWFVKYFRILISSLLEQGSVKTDKEYTQAFVKFVESTTLFQKLSYLIQHFDRSHQILEVCMDIIAFLLEYHNPSVNGALRRANIINSLEKLNIDQQRMEISCKRDRLLDFLMKEESL